MRTMRPLRPGIHMCQSHGTRYDTSLCIILFILWEDWDLWDLIFISSVCLTMIFQIVFTSFFQWELWDLWDLAFISVRPMALDMVPLGVLSYLFYEKIETFETWYSFPLPAWLWSFKLSLLAFFNEIYETFETWHSFLSGPWHQIWYLCVYYPLFSMRRLRPMRPDIHLLCLPDYDLSNCLY